ncbi:hypothetical protein HD554DRAFT_900579 [Boletus coccyginus]|nr:hypothetical protein HD554DRAFT_900579 [Boletus coccyginus]
MSVCVGGTLGLPRSYAHPSGTPLRPPQSCTVWAGTKEGTGWARFRACESSRQGATAIPTAALPRSCRYQLPAFTPCWGTRSWYPRSASQPPVYQASQSSCQWKPPHFPTRMPHSATSLLEVARPLARARPGTPTGGAAKRSPLGRPLGLLRCHAALEPTTVGPAPAPSVRTRRATDAHRGALSFQLIVVVVGTCGPLSGIRSLDGMFHRVL